MTTARKSCSVSRMAKAPNTVRETIDISEQIDNLHIEKAIDLLKGLSAEHPDSWLSLTREYEFGESYEKLYLHYEREKVAIELELDATEEKCRLLQSLVAEAAAFKRNGSPYPRRDEVHALAKELGFLALAPASGRLGIYENEIVVSDMMRGTRRRDGEWIMRMIHAFEMPTDNEELKASSKSLADMQEQHERDLLDVSWVE